MTLLTPAALAELKKRASAATSGPWVLAEPTVVTGISGANQIAVCPYGKFKSPGEAAANALLIAACSPEVVTALVEEIENLRTLVKRGGDFHD